MEALSLIVSALDFAARKHRDQRRKDHEASPYINHPISLVKILVIEAQIYDEEILASAILHDTIEDTNTTFDEIKEHFGVKIATIVNEVTDDTSLTRSERKNHQINFASQLSKEASYVKLADKISNLRDLVHAPPKHWNQDRKEEYCQWAVKVIEKVAHPHPILLALFEDTVKAFSKALNKTI